MATLAERQQNFFSSPYYAVIGASKDQSKYGTKVLRWYKVHGKTVTPIHPKEDSLDGVDALRRLSDLPSPGATSISIVTPPSVTLNLLREAKSLGIPALWLQPGAEDDAVKKFVEDEGLSDKVVLGGPCVLVDGEQIIKSLL